MRKIINGIRYNTKAATLLADTEFSGGGTNRLNSGAASYLYRSPKGRYFTYRETIWAGEEDSITPVETEEAAARIWEGMRNQHVAYEEAFPNLTVEDA